MKIAIIVSRFNDAITDKLLKGAMTAFEEKGFGNDCVEIFYVPGAFEIPLVLKRLCRKNMDKKIYDGVMTIGCVIKGETAHFEYICESVSAGINKISYEFEMPVGFCVLTCYTPLQAAQRCVVPADASNNKGYEAALTVLEMINLLKKI